MLLSTNISIIRTELHAKYFLPEGSRTIQCNSLENVGVQLIYFLVGNINSDGDVLTKILRQHNRGHSLTGRKRSVRAQTQCGADKHGRRGITENKTTPCVPTTCSHRLAQQLQSSVLYLKATISMDIQRYQNSFLSVEVKRKKVISFVSSLKRYTKDFRIFMKTKIDYHQIRENAEMLSRYTIVFFESETKP